MADGSIILDTRINNKGAYAELKELQAKAKSTAQQVAALDKQINTANSKHLALGKELSDAQSKAESTAAELENVNEQLDSFVKRRAEIEKQRNPLLTPEAANLKAQEFVGQHFASDAAKASELQGALDKLQQSIPGLTEKYHQQESVLADLQKQHSALTSQLANEEQAVTRQSSLAQYLNGEDSMQAYFNKQAADIEKSFAKIRERQNKAYGTMNETATQHAELIVAETQKAVPHRIRPPRPPSSVPCGSRRPWLWLRRVNPQPPQANPQRWRGKPRLPRLPLRGPPRLWGSLAVDLQVLCRGHWYLT